MEDATAGRRRTRRFGSGVILVQLATWAEWNLLHPKGQYPAPRDCTILRICHAQDHSYLAPGEAIWSGIGPICRWQIHLVCSKRVQTIQYHVDEKLPLTGNAGWPASPPRVCGRRC